MSFDLLSRPYHLLERITFGAALHRARTRYLDHAVGARNMLIVGEGDGRFLQSLRRINPGTRVTVVDLSGKMLSLARVRNGDLQTTYLQADVRTQSFPDDTYDLIVTHFLLDCFCQATVDMLIAKLARAATPDAVWLVADFHLPAGPVKRLHARLWLATMYTFFRLTTNIEARDLPTYDRGLADAGFALQAEQLTRVNLLRTTVWKRGS